MIVWGGVDDDHTVVAPPPGLTDHDPDQLWWGPRRQAGVEV